MAEYKIVETWELKPFLIRDIRPSVVEGIKEKIEENGFNPSKPLTAVEIDYMC